MTAPSVDRRIQDFSREHKGTVPPKRDPPDKTLVDNLLAYLAPYSPGEAEAITGFSYQTITNYRDGAWKRLEYATRRRIVAFLADPPSPEEAERRIEASRRATAPASAATPVEGEAPEEAADESAPQLPEKARTRGTGTRGRGGDQ